MLFALGAASTALDAVQSLTSSITSNASSSQSTGFNPFVSFGGASATASASPATWSGGWSQVSPATMSALLAAQGQSSTGSTAAAPASPSAALQNLFSQIDSNGDGQITQTEFENALGAGGTNIALADKVFSQLTNGSGTLSLGELASALQGADGKGGEHHHHDEDSGASGSNGSGTSGAASADALTQSLQAASATSVTNSNGSTTTSLTYANGSTVSMTTPAATATSSAATSSYNFVEQMIARQASAISASTSAPLAVSA
jgi:hypothetical protein